MLMKVFIAGILAFSFFFSVGILLARHKPLWNDELYGQQSTVQRTSWPDIISGRQTEWNNFPLFYALQKGILQLFHYQLPFVWDGSGLVVNPHAQIVLRVLPDILMSIALSAIVLFFGLRSGFAGGLAAALICLSTPMVWLYWVEARAYSLWFVLTVFQSLLFLGTASKKGTNAPAAPFALVHTGLCLTAPFGIVQTIVCQGLLWSVGTRRVRFHIIAGLLPLFLGAHYIWAQQKFGAYLFASWQDIFLRNYPLEGIIFLGVYAVLLCLLPREEGSRKYFLFGRVFFPFCLAFMAIALAGLFYVVCSSASRSLPVVERQFIFLTPMGMIMTAAIFSDLWLATPERPWRRLGGTVIFAAGLLAQFLSTFETVDHFYVYF